MMSQIANAEAKTVPAEKAPSFVKNATLDLKTEVDWKVRVGLAGRYFDKMNFKRFNDIFPSDIDALKKWDGFKLSWINVAFFVSGLLVNVYSIFVRFATMPERDSDVHLNLAEIILAHSEFIILLFLIVCGAVNAIIFCVHRHTYDPLTEGMFYVDARNMLKYIATFSVLKIFGYQSEMNKALRFLHAELYRTSLGKPGVRDYAFIGSLVLIVIIFAVGVGAFSVAIKVSQIAFVTDESMLNWTYVEWVNFLSFINSMICIVDLSSIRNDATMQIVFAGDNASYEANERDAQKTFVEWASYYAVKKDGWWGFLSFATADYTMYQKLVITEYNFCSYQVTGKVQSTQQMYQCKTCSPNFGEEEKEAEYRRQREHFESVRKYKFRQAGVFLAFFFLLVDVIVFFSVCVDDALQDRDEHTFTFCTTEDLDMAIVVLVSIFTFAFALNIYRTFLLCRESCESPRERDVDDDWVAICSDCMVNCHKGHEVIIRDGGFCMCGSGFCVDKHSKETFPCHNLAKGDHFAAKLAFEEVETQFFGHHLDNSNSNSNSKVNDGDAPQVLVAIGELGVEEKKEMDAGVLSSERGSASGLVDFTDLQAANAEIRALTLRLREFEK